MKKRKGFRPITIDGKKFQYAVSLSSGIVVFYDENDNRIPVKMIPVETDKPTWRGKHKDGGWGKAEVAELFRRTIPV